MNRVPVFLKWLTGSLLALALFTGLFMLESGTSSPVAQPSSSAVPAIQQIDNLLVLLTDDDRAVTGAVLLTPKAYVAIDPLTVIDNPKFQVSPLRDGIVQGSELDGVNALGDALGIHIDGAIIMQRLAIAGLVDSVGGVDVALSSGSPVHVEGPAASNYVVNALATDSRDYRDERIDEVLSGVIPRLSNDVATVADTLSALGSLCRTTVPTAEVARFLGVLGDQWPMLERVQVPVVATDLNATEIWSRVATSKMPALLANQLNSYVLTDERVRISVRSNIATDRLSARNTLDNAGFVFLDGGSAGLPKRTTITVSKALPAEVQAKLVSALGLKSVVVKVNAKQSTSADVVVVLGVDYRGTS